MIGISNRIGSLLYGGGGAPAIFVSNAGSGDESGSSEDNAMPFATWKTQFQAGTLSGTFYFKKGEVYDFSDFDVPTPSTQCSNLRVTSITDTEHILEFDRGDGDMILVARRSGAAVTWEPTNDTEYHIHDDLGDNTTIAFIGSGTYEIISGLTADTEYHYKAWEFNTNDVEFKYLLTNAPTLSESTFTTNFGTGLSLAIAQGWTTPTFEQQKVENTSIKDAITRGIMAQAPRFYNFYSKNTDPNWRGINWKSPSLATQALFVGGITHNAEGGVTGAGSTGYINFQWNPSTQGGGLVSATDMAVATNIRNWVSGASLYGIFGSGAGGDAAFELRVPAIVGNSVAGRLNTIGATGAAIAPINIPNNGLWIAEVSAVDTAYISIDDSVIFDGSSAGIGAAIPNANFVGLARNRADVEPDTVDTFVAATMDFFIPYKTTTVSRADIKAWWAAHKARIDEL